jgi:TolB-like protein/tetratricopeptide (TPR) repeat protein
MVESNKAVFLSYASQDAGAARRICDSLRAAGIVVWFDESELRSGDAWDQKIRREIRDCALFIPIISANTQARLEGYFRREWKLGVERTHAMADEKAFLLPVVLDEISSARASVPEAFRSVQWTRLDAGTALAGFAERVRRLLYQDAVAPAIADLPRLLPETSHGGAAPPDDTPSIAVLPFVNMSRDEENEYFADGLSEELLNVLAKIRGLRVASRTSAFWFKGQQIDIPTVAQKLNVATILEGSVRKSGKRVRITVQLIEVASDSHLWSETYDRELDDIFAVQDDIAQSVVEELRTALLGGQAGGSPSASAASAAADVRRASAGRSHSPEAYQLYLQGKFFGERISQADSDKAIALFERALEIDPDFALAWTGIARVRSVQAGYGFSPIAEGYEKAREAARNALRLNPELAEAHTELGLVQSHFDWDWQAAQASLRRALELEPGNAHALHAAANLARVLGNVDEAIRMLQRAIEVDPLSVHMYRELGLNYWLDKNLDACAAALERAIDLSPNAGLSHAFLALTRLEQGRTEQALPLAQTESHGVFRNMAVAVIQHALGHPAQSDAALQTVIDDYGWTAAYQVAEVYAYRGQSDRAFEWLEKGYAQRDPGVAMSARDPYLASLHADPRWRPFLERINVR